MSEFAGIPSTAVIGLRPEEGPNPAEVFAEHVQMVRDRDADALDMMHRLSVSSAVKAGVLIGAPTGFIAEASSRSLDPGILTAVGTTGVALIVKFVQNRRDRAKAEVLFDREAQATVGQRYELYRMRGKGKEGEKHPLAMRWYGPMGKPSPDDTSDPFDDLEFTAQVAKQNDIRHLVVGDDLLKKLGTKVQGGDPRLTTMQALLKDRENKLRTGGRTETDIIHALSPQEWLEAVELHRQETGHSLSGMLEQLGAIRYDHPLARLAREYKGHQQLRDEKLRAAARASVMRQLSDAAAGRTPLGFPERYQVWGSIDTKGEYVHLHHNGVYDRTATLNEALGTNDAKLNAALANADTNPNAAIRALEVFIFKKLQQIKHEAAVPEDAPVTANDDTKQYQSEIAAILEEAEAKPGNWPTITRLRARKIQRAAALVLSSLTAFVGVAAGSNMLTAGFNESWGTAYETEVDKRGVDNVEIYDPVVMENIGPWQMWNKALTIQGAVYDFLNPGVFGRGAMDMSDIEFSTYNFDLYGAALESQSIVGNVDRRSANRADWHVDGTISTEGYWAAGVKNQLIAYGGADYELKIRWDEFENGSEKFTKTALPVTLPEGTAEYLVVTRNLSLLDFENDNNLTRIAIPVREGTRPAAAALNGEPLTLVERNNGTFFFEFPTDDMPNQRAGGGLRFWLVPDAAAPAPRATNKQYGEIIGIRDEPTLLNKTWEELIPGLPAATGDPKIDEQRSRMIEAHISSTWQYKLEPWRGGPMDGVASFDELALRAAVLGAANCNVATTLLVSENPNLMPVTGYRNSGKGPGGKILSSHESHMWAANAAGARFDPTPSGGISPEDAAFFNEDHLTDGKSSTDDLYLYANLALVAAGVALWQRRRIVRGGKAIAAGGREVAAELADLGKRRLATMPVEDLRLATRLLETAGYAADGSIDVASIRIRTNSDNSSAEKLLERLLRPNTGLQTPRVRQAVRTAAKDTTGDDRKVLQQAATLARRAERITRYSRAPKARKRR